MQTEPMFCLFGARLLVAGAGALAAGTCVDPALFWAGRQPVPAAAPGSAAGDKLP